MRSYERTKVALMISICASCFTKIETDFRADARQIFDPQKGIDHLIICLPHLFHSGSDADAINGLGFNYMTVSNNYLSGVRNLCACFIIGFAQTTKTLFLRITDRQRQIGLINLA